MRPLYETSEQLEAEKSFMSDIEKLRAVRFFKLPIDWKVDAFVKRGQRTIAIAELKVRNIAYNQFPDIILSERKVKAGLKLQRHLWGIEKTFQSAKKLQFLFLVRLLDGDYYTEVKDDDSYVVDVGGRTVTTRDAQDIERVVHIPIQDFKRLETR